ncbi:alpha/beta fold hydrolase [Lederbergia panacisoli]|uniref:alpha/beta fold hydrolase n=1 Tax=Lederbergia panacisoli TaxID=1255251 RepID=UPI00214C0AC1|nr:alpha/beta hydrolase [Lederbergia panacisoli]MCR2823805.1 alpha/beta fold hydrolase [Lederbergia panacisoli]
MPILRKKDINFFYTINKAKHNDQAETLILIHTNITDHTLYNSILPFVNDHLNVVTYDLRGFGQSDRGDEEITIDLYVEDLKFLIESLKLNSVYIAAMGFSGLVALKFSILYEKMVKKMVLMTLACFPEEEYDLIRGHRSLITSHGSYIPTDSLLKKTTNLTEEQPEYGRFRNIINKTPLDLYSKIMGLTLYTQPIPFMNETRIPTLILSGERELIFPQYLVALNAIHLKHFKYSVVPNASSFMMIDQPEMTGKFITEFCAMEKQDVYQQDEIACTINEKMRLYSESVYLEGTKRKTYGNHIQVELLHSFRVEVNGRLITKGWNQRYAKQIFIFLLFHKTASREQICDTLWPKMHLYTSKKNLRVYLSHLKSILDDSVLVVDREHIYLNGEITCDALELIEKIDKALYNRDDEEKARSTFEIFSELQSVNYLTAIFDDWFLEKRDNIESRLIQLAVWTGQWLLDTKGDDLAEDFLENSLKVLEDCDEIYNLLYQISPSWLAEKEKSLGLGI